MVSPYTSFKSSTADLKKCKAKAEKNIDDKKDDRTNKAETYHDTHCIGCKNSESCSGLGLLKYLQKWPLMCTF